MYLFASIGIFGRSVYSMSNYNKYARNVCQKVFRIYYVLSLPMFIVNSLSTGTIIDVFCIKTAWTYDAPFFKQTVKNVFKKSCSVLTENTSTLHTQFHNDSFIRVTQEILPFRYVISILKFTYEYDSIDYLNL